MSSRSLNRVTLIGNLTHDPELKYTLQGTAVCSFAVATNRNWTTATGDLKEDVQYHRITAWRKLAALCGKLLAKGRKVYLEGRITYRNYIGKDGVQRNITEIVLDDFVLLDSVRRNAAGASVPQHTSTQQSPPPATKEENATNDFKNQKEAATEADVSDEKIEPDDIPF